MPAPSATIALMTMPTSRRDDLVRLFHSLLIALTLALPLQTRAQNLDTELPSGAFDSGVLGQPQLVEADVGEGTELADITLRYRFDAGGDYTSFPMRATQRPGVYAASVPTRGVQARSMEFYIVAEDTDGGQLLKGSAAVPLVRELTTPTSNAGTPPSPEEPIVTSTQTIESEPETTDTGNRKYLYYVLGALAVGAIAAAASSGGGGGGGSSSGESCGADGCDLTLVLPAP